MIFLCFIASSILGFHAVFCRIPSIRSSCSFQDHNDWSTNEVKNQIKVWLESIVAVPEDGLIGASWFDRETSKFYKHSTTYLGNFEENLKNTKYDWRALTVGHLDDEKRKLVWQKISHYRIDGYLYGVLDERGLMTGPDITYIYPDYQTGIKGEFKDGLLEKGYEVEITGCRCKNGFLEIKTEVVNHEVIWSRVDMNLKVFPGPYATIQDPLERKSVYVKESTIPDANEGLFTKRMVLPGEVISYYAGVLLNCDTVVYNPETGLASDSAMALSFDNFSPKHWRVPDNYCLDIPDPFRDWKKYNSTLAHKANHKFTSINAVFRHVFHPVYGFRIALLASRPIQADEEIFVNYEYEINDDVPLWYRKDFLEFKKEKSLENCLKKKDCSLYKQNATVN